jgi:hypothetical protein
MGFPARKSDGNTMHKTVKLCKSRVEFFLQSNDIRGVFLPVQPLFQRGWDLGVGQFEEPLEGSFWFVFVDPAFSLPGLAFTDTLEVGIEKVIEDRVDGLQSGEGLVP